MIFNSNKLENLSQKLKLKFYVPQSLRITSVIYSQGIEEINPLIY